MRKKIKKYSFLMRKVRHFFGKTMYRAEMDEKQAIFIHVPKAAGTSICKAVFGCPNSNHYTARCYRSDDPRKFQDYFKFTVVRNPYERFKSAYYYLKEGGDRLSEKDKNFRDDYLMNFSDINDFALNGLDSDEIDRRPHFDLQHEYIFDKDNITLLVDCVGKMEDLDDFSHQLTKKMCFKVKIGHQNKTNSNGETAELTESAKLKVYKKYKNDFDLLGYKK